MHLERGSMLAEGNPSFYLDQRYRADFSTCAQLFSPKLCYREPASSLGFLVISSKGVKGLGQNHTVLWGFVGCTSSEHSSIYPAVHPVLGLQN